MNLSSPFSPAPFATDELNAIWMAILNMSGFGPLGVNPVEIVRQIKVVLDEGK